jgi:3-oxosteroid 1-dehydrogenase
MMARNESRSAGLDYVTDIVVVGAGCAGLVSALAAKESGKNVLVVESTSVVGGSSALSGGGLWIPNNSIMKASGAQDSYEAASTYLDTVIGDVGPASSPERRNAFLTEGPKMVDWLKGLGFQFRQTKGYPDYYPERPGGSTEGRCVEGEIFDWRKLGPWEDKIRVPSATGMPWPIPLHTSEANKLALALRTRSGFSTAIKAMGLRSISGRLQGKRPAGMGASLIGQLLQLVVARSIPIWLQSPMLGLTERDGTVYGIVVQKEGKKMSIGVTCAVILTSGGFAHNLEMRQEFHPHPITTDWTSASPGDLGDAIRAGMSIGAATALMDDAWWGPSFIDKDGLPNFFLAERSLPFGFIVDSSGERFMNESASYVDCGHLQYERNKTVPAIPAYLIFDSRHRSHYLFGTMMPHSTPKEAFESGFMVRADSLEDLARACSIDSAGLLSTAKRFKGFCQTGKDEDFHRGDSAYDRFYSDPRVRPNPNLGSVERPPFYAVKVWPGDLGTKGGLLTDEYARVLREDGSVIKGLYAAGNTSASVMGHTYPGPGSTIGPAMTFGYIAARHAASESTH